MIVENCRIRDSQLESFLSSRKQRVLLENDVEVYVSDEKEITSGVPQNSVAGPLLNIICYIQITYYNSEKMSCRLFTDDRNY